MTIILRGEDSNRSEGWWYEAHIVSYNGQIFGYNKESVQRIPYSLQVRIFICMYSALVTRVLTYHC